MLYCGRHDFGTMVASRTGNLKAVMKVMGHKDVKTAMKYQHPEIDIVRAALNSGWSSDAIGVVVRSREKLRHTLRHTQKWHPGKLLKRW